MTDYPSNLPMTVERAHQLLKSFDCANPRQASNLDNKTLQDAIITLAQHSDYRIFGVCADNVAQGYTALQEYTQILGDHLESPCPEHEGPVYIKFNTKTGLFHVDGYTGTHRGVLVSCQSAYDDGVNDLYGHLPLDLFVDGGVDREE